MRIINNADINNLIIYSKKNLGIYKLVYNKHKKLYLFSIILTVLEIILLIIYILLLVFKLGLLFENVCFGICFSNSMMALYLLYILNKRTKKKRLKVQNVRYRLLKRYYNENNFSVDDLKKINQLLNQRVKKIEKQKTTILIVLGILLLPIWDVFVQNYLAYFSAQKLIKIILLCIVLSFFIVLIIKLCNRGLYLYEENIYIKNNVSLIENLIYLNTYILQKKKVRKKHGRGC